MEVVLLKKRVLVRAFIVLLVCTCIVFFSLAQIPSPNTNGVLFLSQPDPVTNAAGYSVLGEDRYPNPAVRQRLNAILGVIRPYIREIEATGKELLAAENTSPTKITNSSFEVNGLYEGYFNNISKIPSVRTVFINKDFEAMQNLLFHNYYDYSSNDCEYLANHSMPTAPKALLQPIPDLKCVSRNESLKGQLLHKKHLDIGLPFNYQHQLNNETWTYIHIIQNAILTKSGLIRTRNVTIRPAQCYTFFRMSADMWPSDIDSAPVYDEVFSITHYWGEAFYHFTHEAAPRLAPYIELLNNNPQIKIVIHGPQKWPLYNFFGIKNFKNRLIEEKYFRAKVLYSPAGGPCGKSPIFTTHLLSLYARQYLPNTQRNRVVLIKRTHKRFFRHHDDIARTLKLVCEKHDVDFYVFSDDPLPSAILTVRMFNEALIVVAPHGAGTSNLIYSQPGTVMIEGTHWDTPKTLNLCYRQAAQALGHIFYGLVNKYPSGVFDVTAGQVKDAVTFFLQHLLSRPTGAMLH